MKNKSSLWIFLCKNLFDILFIQKIKITKTKTRKESYSYNSSLILRLKTLITFPGKSTMLYDNPRNGCGSEWNSTTLWRSGSTALRKKWSIWTTWKCLLVGTGWTLRMMKVAPWSTISATRKFQHCNTLTIFLVRATSAVIMFTVFAKSRKVSSDVC